MSKLSLLFVFAVAVCAIEAAGVKRSAIAFLKTSTITGNVTFEQTDHGPVRVQAYFTGLPVGDHGFHIHEKGDISTCALAGGHYNPFGKSHGAPTASERHVGDLGNINSDGNVAKLDMTDNLLSLVGDHNIIGRAVVVHENKDDLGLGDSPDSKKTGNAGGRLACGVIGIKNPVDEWHHGKSGSSTFSMLSMAALSVVGSILTIL